MTLIAAGVVTVDRWGGLAQDLGKRREEIGVVAAYPVTLPGPGTYRARVHAHSVESCGGFDKQTGPARSRRFSVV